MKNIYTVANKIEQILVTAEASLYKDTLKVEVKEITDILEEIKNLNEKASKLVFDKSPEDMVQININDLEMVGESAKTIMTLTHSIVDQQLEHSSFGRE